MSDKATKETTQSSSTIKWIVFVWFVLMFLGLMYYTTARLVDFDPNAKLLEQSTSEVFYQELSQGLSHEFGSVAGRVFHFSQQGCFCNLVAEAHISDVKALVTQEQQENIEVSLAEFPEFQAFIPSTPAVGIYNKNGELIYLGPYSTGYLCTTGNGLVEEVIPLMATTDQAPIVMSLARGCYCNTPGT